MLTEEDDDDIRLALDYLTGFCAPALLADRTVTAIHILNGILERDQSERQQVRVV